MSVDLSIVIPAYNEGERLGPVLDRLVPLLNARKESVEIIIVDDGSKDDTVMVATRPGVRVLSYTPNAGKGKAVRTGVLAAHGETILFMDADLSTDLEAIDRALAGLDRGFDVVIGSRALPDSEIVVRQPAYRQRASEIFNILQQQSAGLMGYGDTQCGFKAFRRRAARTVFQRAQIDGFMFDVEALVIAERLGFRILEIPVRWTNDAASRLRIVRDTVRMMPDLLRIRVAARTLPPPITRGPARGRVAPA